MSGIAAGISLGKLAAAATVVGAGVSAYGAYQQGQAASAAAAYNAQAQEANAILARQQAERAGQLQAYQAAWQERDAASAAAHANSLEQRALAERQTANENARRKREENRRILSRMRARIAKSGVAAAGTPIELLADAGGNLELEALQIGHAAEGRVRALHDAAAQSRAAGQRIGAEAALSRYSAAATRTSGAYRSAMLQEDAAFIRASGSSARRAANIQAGASVLGGVTSYGTTRANLRYYGALD